MRDIVWNVFEILVNVYQSFIITHFTYKFLTPKPKKNKKLALNITSLFIAFLITLMNHIMIFESVETLIYW